MRWSIYTKTDAAIPRLYLCYGCQYVLIHKTVSMDFASLMRKPPHMVENVIVRTTCLDSYMDHFGFLPGEATIDGLFMPLYTDT